MACKEGQFDVVELMVNLNAQHVNGMTPFDLALGTVIKYFRVHKKKSKKKTLSLLFSTFFSGFQNFLKPPCMAPGK